VRVRETLDQVLFGGRPDPVGVVSSLGDEFRRGGGPQQWLDALRASVDLPWAALHQDVEHRADEVVATSGHPVEQVTTIALYAGDEHVGDLVVGLPEHHRELPRATDAVLRLVAGPLARALQSARLAAQLQESRRLVVLAAEEERRRLRRDLHDGLGPVLAGVGYTADAARNVLDARPERSAELLSVLREDVGGAIAEVRRLVHDLRPAVLDQLGLVAAVRQQAERVTQDGAGPAVTVEAGTVGTLPAAVELAAYRVVSEAVLNVVRHAGARRVRVTVRREDGTLELLVADDGRSGAAWGPGVGLTSMRERLAQLGGTLEAGATPDGGRVRARLPL
jgi:signal transduction histidine kinase